MSFGPDMQLARELLERGQRAPVLEYFKLCAVLWELGGEHLQRWTQRIQHGQVPDFGPNLGYVFKAHEGAVPPT